MKRFPMYRILLVILTLTLALSACAPLTMPVSSSGTAPTPVVMTDGAAVDNPDVFIDPQQLAAALLETISARDEARLQKLMTGTFVIGWWRGEMGDYTQADALRNLYADQLGSEIKLAATQNVDLAALLGGVDPLTLLGSDSAVIRVVHVTGWGKDGKDEALLLIAVQPDDRMLWKGVLAIQGGFTSPETDGVEPYANTDSGYSMFLPKGYEIIQTTPDSVMIFAPQDTQGHRERATITVEPANGRTAEQAAQEATSGMPADMLKPGTVMGLDNEMALMLDKLPGQDLNRQVFVIHAGRLYRMAFFPQNELAGADPAAVEATRQMENLYAVVLNTFQFIPAQAAAPSGGKLVADIDVYLNLLGQGLAERDSAGLQSMMGDPFVLAAWRSEGQLVTPAEGAAQILQSFVPAGAQLALVANDAVIQQYFAQPAQTDAGETLIPVHVTGWGPEGKDEAVLFIARRPDGSLYWHSVVTAAGGFQL